MRRAALGALALAACGGVDGTYALSLVSAPGSDLPARIQHARLTLSNPRTVIEEDRGPDGFTLALEVEADGTQGDVTFEGFDAGGARIAYGRTPSLALAAFDFAVAIYVAPPQSLAAAPVALEPPRRDLGTAAFPFGVLVAGGVDGAGATSDRVEVYDVFAHGWKAGKPLPAPRAALTIGPSASGFAYMLGGLDAAGAPTGTLWRFDTQVPATTAGGGGGEYAQLDDEPTLARAGAAIAQVASEGFLVTGSPPVVIDGLTRALVPATAIPPLAGTATSVIADVDGTDTLFAVFVGAGTGTRGVVRAAPTGTTDEAEAPAAALRVRHGAVPAGPGRVVALGGAIADVPVASALVALPATRSYTELPDVLATPRVDAAIAAANGLIVVAGGTDATGAIVGDAEILDAATLARVAIVPMVVPRTGAVARPLANGQVLIVGGVDAAGAPVGTVELYTPDP